MNKTRKRSFAVLLGVLVCALALVLSLGILSACGSDESASVDESTSSGSTWYYGDKAPAESLGEEGDYYLNTETLASYVKEGKVWREATNSETGVSWYYGTAKPDDNLGVEHDFYLNTSTGELYQKSEGGWGTPILTLKGTPGRDGVMWHSGEGDPNTSEAKPDDAKAGDFYLDTKKFDVYQLKADGTTWERLGSIKGDPGEDAKDPIQFYDGYGDPNVTDPVTDPQEGDLFLGKFSGLDEEGPTAEGSGFRLYRYHEGKWDIVMESMNKTTLNIYSYEELLVFATSVGNGTYNGTEVHLKTDIDFNDVETASLHRAAPLAAGGWTPIGTADHPFTGIFDGEGHIIENFSVKTTDDAKVVGFFGYIKGATIEHLHFEGVTVEVASGSVGGAVVGEAKGAVSFVDVTVSGSVKAADGTEDATVGGLVGSLAGTDEETNVTVDGSSFEGSGAKDLIGDQGEVENVTVTDSSVTDEKGSKTEWDESGKIVHKVSTAQELIDLVNSGVDLSKDKILLMEDLDFTDAKAAGKAYMIKDCLFELDGDGHHITGLKYAMFLYVKGGSYLHDFTIDLDVNLTNPANNKLARGAIAENIVGSDISTEVTVENVVAKGNAVGMRAAFFDESGEDGKTGTLNFINCRSEVNITSTGSSEITKLAAFLNLPDKWNVNFIDCVNDGSLTYNAAITSNAVMGGFVSYAQGNGSNTVTFTRCINAGKVELYYDVSIGLSDPDIGGFVGKVQGPTNLKFIDCVNTATVSCTYSLQTISIGGFVGQSVGGSIVFEGKNVNGAYTNSDDSMVADVDMGKIVVDSLGGDVRAGGFVGYPGAAAITVNGTLVNAGEVAVKQREGDTSKFIAYAGGLFGHTTPSVTFAEDCAYYNLGKVTVTVASATGSVAYVGGIVGYISNGTYTLGATATGYNAGTLTATNAETMYTGSFAGCVYAGAGLTEEGLTGFTDSGSVEKKIGQTL